MTKPVGSPPSLLLICPSVHWKTDKQPDLVGIYVCMYFCTAVEKEEPTAAQTDNGIDRSTDSD
jgi:hypothetical protein